MQKQEFDTVFNAAHELRLLLLHPRPNDPKWVADYEGHKRVIASFAD